LRASWLVFRFEFLEFLEIFAARVCSSTVSNATRFGFQYIF